MCKAAVVLCLDLFLSALLQLVVFITWFYRESSENVRKGALQNNFLKFP